MATELQHILGEIARGLSEWYAFATYVFLLGLAMRSLRGADRWSARLRPRALAYAGTLIVATFFAAILIVTVGMAAKAGASDILSQTFRVTTTCAFLALVGAVSLAADESLRSMPRPASLRRPSRPFPWLDYLRARRRAFGARRNSASATRTNRQWPTLIRFRDVVECMGWLALVLVYSGVWLRIAARWAGAEIAPDLAEVLKSGDGAPLVLPVVSVIALAMLAPFFEEVVYRGFVLDGVLVYVRRKFRFTGHWPAVIAIVVSALLWALAHQGQIEPCWAKWVQIAGIGVVLGIARVRFGLEACMLLHLAFNILGGLVVPRDFIPSP